MAQSVVNQGRHKLLGTMRQTGEVETLEQKADTSHLA